MRMRDTYLAAATATRDPRQLRLLEDWAGRGSEDGERRRERDLVAILEARGWRSIRRRRPLRFLDPRTGDEAEIRPTDPETPIQVRRIRSAADLLEACVGRRYHPHVVAPCPEHGWGGLRCGMQRHAACILCEPSLYERVCRNGHTRLTCYC